MTNKVVTTRKRGSSEGLEGPINSTHVKLRFQNVDLSSQSEELVLVSSAFQSSSASTWNRSGMHHHSSCPMATVLRGQNQPVSVCAPPTADEKATSLLRGRARKVYCWRFFRYRNLLTNLWTITVHFPFKATQPGAQILYSKTKGAVDGSAHVLSCAHRLILVGKKVSQNDKALTVNEFAAFRFS